MGVTHEENNWDPGSWEYEEIHYYYDSVNIDEIDSTITTGTEHPHLLTYYEYYYYQDYYDVYSFNGGRIRNLQRFDNQGVIISGATIEIYETQPLEYYQYTYTPTGLLETYHHYTWADSDYNIDISTHWYYNATGKPDSLYVSGTLTYPYNSNTKVLFSYDADNNCYQQDEYYTNNNSDWLLFSNTNTTFALSFGEWKPVSDSISFNNNEIPTPHYTLVTYSYSNANLRTAKVSTTIYGYMREHSTLTTEYNSAGKQIYNSSSYSDETFSHSEETVYTWQNYVGNDEQVIPQIMGLVLHAYPTPFNDKCVFSWNNDKTGRVILEIYNLKGQIVRRLLDDVKSSGMLTYSWDGNTDNGQKLASGVYIAKVKTKEDTALTKVVLFK